MVTSVATSKPQPSDAAYGIDVLKLFKEYDRSGYNAAFGVDPPTYNPALPTKSWFDSAADLTEEYTYTTYDASGGLSGGIPALKTITIPGVQALAVNIPGVHSYPPYAIEPTTAGVVDPTGLTVSPVVASNLSTRDQAVALAAEIGLGPEVIGEFTMTPLYKIAYPESEKRRIWIINFKSAQVTVGRLLQAKSKNGVGAPGHWNLDGAEPNWISELPSPNSMPPANPLQPVPMRELLANEKFNLTLGGVQVERTDSEVAQGQTSAGGGVTGDSPLLKQIADDVKKLLGVFHLT